MSDGIERPPNEGDDACHHPIGSFDDRYEADPGIASNVRDIMQQDSTQQGGTQQYGKPAGLSFTQLDLAEESFLAALRGSFEVCDEGEMSRAQVNRLLRDANQRPSNLRLVSSNRPARGSRRSPSSFDPRSELYEDMTAGRRHVGMRRALLAALVVGSAVAGIAGLQLGGFDVLDWTDGGLARGSGETQIDTLVSAPVRTRSELVLSSGTVTVDGLAVVFGRDPLEVGQRIATKEGRACLTADPNVEVCLDDDTEVQIVSLVPDDIRFDVLRGAAVAQLSPLPPGHAFALTAGPVRAEAIGTVFEVSHDPKSARAQVTVLAGKVGVSVLSHDAVQVPAHTRMGVDLSAAKALEMETVGRVEESRIWSQLAFSEWWRPAEVGIAEIVPIGDLTVDGQSSETQTAFARVDGGPSLPLPIRTLLPLGQHRVVMTDASGAERSVEFEVKGGESRRVELPLTPSEKPTLATGVQAGVVRTASDLLRAARELRQQRNPAAALRAYSELRSRYPSSSEAHTVLVTMGKLQLELGRPSEALSNFERYLRSSGPLGPEALAGKVSALRALGEATRERVAIEEYLRRYPDGFLAPRLEQRLEALH